MRLSSLIALLLAATPAAAMDLGTVAGTGLSLEGLLQGDATWFDEDASALAGGSDDRATAIRRAELVLEGDGPRELDWVVGYDAKAEKWLDVNLALPLGPGSLKLGQSKQPNSLEELSSTKNNDFISKAGATNTFAVSRRAGVSYTLTGDRWTLAASAFGRELGSGGAQGSGVGVRGTFAPVQGDGRLLHIGLSWVDHDTHGDAFRLRARPQADLAARRLVDTGALLDADRVTVAGAEVAWIAGPVKLQGEWLHAGVARLAAPDFGADGGYLSAVWNLGGRSWGYKGGVPTTPLPAAGESLWQTGLRLDRLDLDDAGVAGGTLDAVTLGLNWYAGPHVKAMLNLVDVRSERQGVSDDPAMVEMRLQLHW